MIGTAANAIHFAEDEFLMLSLQAAMIFIAVAGLKETELFI